MLSALTVECRGFESQLFIFPWRKVVLGGVPLPCGLVDVIIMYIACVMCVKTLWAHKGEKGL